MNIQHSQTKMTTANSIYQTKLANRERHDETFHTRNEQVTISEQGWNKYTESLKFNQVSENDPMVQRFRQFYEEYNSAEAIEKRKLEQLKKENLNNCKKNNISTA